MGILIALLTALGYFPYAKRYQLAAKVWHWRNGYSARVGNYDALVPEHWLIIDGNSIAFTLINTAPVRCHRDAKLHTTAVIEIFPFRDRPIGTSGIESWLSFMRQSLERERVESVEQKTLRFEDEVLTCIGGRELRAMMREEINFPDTDLVSLHCKSANDLYIQFLGEPSDIQPFYAFVSGIRRHR